MKNKLSNFYKLTVARSKKHWLSILTLFSILICLIVHLCYKFPAPSSFFIAVWDAGDLLDYLGSIIGSIATIYVLQETIIFTKKQSNDEHKYSIRPFFRFSVTTSLQQPCDNCIELNNNCSIVGNSFTISIRVRNIGAGNGLVKCIKIYSDDSREDLSYSVEHVILKDEEYIYLLQTSTVGNKRVVYTFHDIEDLGQYKVEYSFTTYYASGKNLVKSTVPTSIQEI